MSQLISKNNSYVDVKPLINRYQQGGKTSELKLSISALTVLDLLQDALAEEFNAWYQYMIAVPYLHGNERTALVKIFKDNAEDELEDHAYWLMERINQLGGEPTKLLTPDNWNKAATHKYITPAFDVRTAIAKNIEAEKCAIETYTKIEGLTRDKDIVTHTKIKQILADEQEHLQDLYDIQKDLQ